MKRIILSLMLLFVISVSNGQTVVYHENFEIPDSVTSSGNPAWFQQAGFYTSFNHCMRDTVALNDSAYLTTSAFDCSSFLNVIFSFNHICKISFADLGTIEVSNDNGANWFLLDNTIYDAYLSASAYTATFSFNSASYGPTTAGWFPNPATGGDTITPTNSWWKTEVFDLSGIFGGASQAKIRFKIKDGNGNGNSRNYGWLIDDINVTASPHELISPVIAWSPPVLTGNVYNLGPYNIHDTITDNTALSTTQLPVLYYTINGGAVQTVTQTLVSGNVWQGVIPAVNTGDTVCYWAQAWDQYSNTAIFPSTGCVSFIASSGISFPFCDNFDSQNLWTSTTTSGSSWQLGTPAFGVTTGALSNPNAWDIDLTSGYLDNTITTLTSPVFDFSSPSAVNSKLSFWRNHNCEAFWDGTRIEYTLDGGATWQIMGIVQPDPNGTNWYTRVINSSGEAAWDGNTNGTWIKSTYKLGSIPGLNGCVLPVQFRFIFTSDASVNYDGFSIDDFCIIPPSPQDLGVSSIVQPGFSAPAGTNDTVKVMVTNYGLNAMSGFNVRYSINGGPPVNQVYSGTIQPGDSALVIFNTTLAVPTGSFGFCAYTSVAADGDHTNDTICTTDQGIPLVNLPYSDDFESPPSIWYDSSAVGTNWQLGTPNFGATNSAFSPVTAWDINLNTAYGNNAYSVLTSPLFNFTGQVNAKLSFWMNRNIAVNDGVYMEYSVNGGTSWTRLGTVGDTNAVNNSWYNNPSIDFTGLPGWDGSSGGWVKYTYILGPPFNNAGNQVQFRFIFTSDFFTVLDGVSVDNFSILPASPQDIGVTSINQPGNMSGAGGNQVVNVTFRNYGTTTITADSLAYSVNGSLVATEPWSGSLAPSATATFSFATTFVVPAGAYDICAYTILAGDGDHTNDTTCKTSHGIPRFTLPFFDNFDTGAVVWVDSAANSLSVWQLGNPSFGQTTGTLSAPNCWDVNLSTAYDVNARCYLTSPLFDFTGIVNAKLTFWQNRNCETGWDGLKVQYSKDGGSTWQVLGTQNDPLSTNWYNVANINSDPGPAWSGASFDSTAGQPGWIKCTYKLVPLDTAGANVMFRFQFTSDASVNWDGVSVDNFKITPPFPLDASALAIVLPGNYAPAATTTPVRVLISNEGSLPISNFDVSYAINSVLTGTTTYTATLQPGAQDTVTLPAFTVPTSNFDICAWTSLTGDGDHTNDTTCKSSFGIPLEAISYADNFDTSAINFFADNGSDWQYGVPQSSVIDSAFSPPNCWKTILAGNYSAGDNDNLYSPFFDFTNAFNAKLTFWHRYISNAGADGGRVDYSSDGGTTWQILDGDPNAVNWYNSAGLFSSGLPGWTGNSGGWIQSVYPLDFLNGDTNLVQFRFNFSSQTFTFNPPNGWAIDNFEVFNPIPRTAAPIQILGINNPFAITGPQIISARIQNRGSFDLNSVNASLVVDGTTIVTDPITYSPALVTDSSQVHVFSVPWNVTLGGHNLCVITSSPNGLPDQNPSDDTLCAFAGEFDSVSVLSASTPYCNDFEPGNGHLSWIPLNAYNYALYSSEWQLGTPDKIVINSAHSPVNAWVTSLHESYVPRDSSGLFSPVFEVSNDSCYELSFWHIYDTELYQDGGIVEYSIDNGGTWHRFGFWPENGWFNSQYITGLVGGPPTPGWSGVSPGWVYAAHNLKFTSPAHVIFRFRFGSDLTNQKEGWAIDDFCFKKVAPCIIGVEEISSGALTLEQSFPNPASDLSTISYSIPQHGKVRLYVSDVLGRVIRVLVDESQSEGIHQSELNVKNMAEGVYYYTLEFNNERMVRKFVVAR